VDFPAPPARLASRLRRICLALPEAEELPAWQGTSFRIRRRIFAHLFGIEQPSGEPAHIVVCRVEPSELAGLVASGHPYFAVRSGGDRIGMVLGPTTDWDEVGELVTDSYRLLAPKKLAALV